MLLTYVTRYIILLHFVVTKYNNEIHIIKTSEITLLTINVMCDINVLAT